MNDLVSQFSQAHPSLKRAVQKGGKPIDFFRRSPWFKVSGSGDKATIKLISAPSGGAQTDPFADLLASVHVEPLCGARDQPRATRCPLASFAYEPSSPFGGTPTPPECLPACISHFLPEAELQRGMQLKPLRLEPWCAHLKECQAEYCEPTTAKLFLKALNLLVAFLSYT